MKKFKLWMLAAILTCGTSLTAQAQYYDTKNELSVSIGAGANSEIIGGMADFTELLATTLVTGTLTGGTYVGHVSYDDEKYRSPIAVAYYRHLTKLIAVGGYVGYNSLKRDMYANWQATGSSSSEKERIGEAKRSNFSVMPSVKFHWVRSKYFGFYSKLGLGATFSSEKQKGKGKDFTDSTVYFNFDITPIGLDFGSLQYRGFVELGMGEQGIICAGLRYKF